MVGSTATDDKYMGRRRTGAGYRTAGAEGQKGEGVPPERRVPNAESKARVPNKARIPNVGIRLIN